jgi:peptidoglycan/LPS O-acetylase OafA/YrhL
MSGTLTVFERTLPAEAALDLRPAAEPIAAAADACEAAKIGDIELLRGVAIIFVLIEHTSFNLVHWGSPVMEAIRNYFGLWTGVDLFLAISGFVIARSLLPALNRCKNAVQFWNLTLAFWIRRAWRLLPSAWLWLALLLAASIWLNRSGAFRDVSANVQMTVAAVLDVANVYVAEILSKRPLGAAFPYWSLSLEEQFYLLLPVAAFLCRRFLPQFLAVAVLAQILLPRTEMLYIINLRTDAMLLGVLIAIWSRSGRRSYLLCEPKMLGRSRLAQFAVLVVPLWMIAGMGSHVLDIVPMRVGVVAVLAALLVLVASYDRDYLMRKGPVKSVFLWFGSRSYTLYLTHIPAFFLTREIWYRIEPDGTNFGTGAFAGRYAITAICLLVCFTELNYRFVETPLRRKGVRIARRIATRPLPQAVPAE